MTDIPQILLNLSKAYPALWRMVTAMCFAAGFLFALRSIYAFKIYGEARTMMNPQTSLRAPLFYLFVAATLIYTPTGFHMVMQTLYGYPIPESLKYVTGYSDDITTAIKTCLGLVQFVGIIAFFRGWLLLAKHAHQGGGGQHGIGKAFTHILGGIMAVNIVGTYNVFANTLALPPLHF